MATVRSFKVTSDKFNVDRNFTEVIDDILLSAATNKTTTATSASKNNEE